MTEGRLKTNINHFYRKLENRWRNKEANRENGRGRNTLTYLRSCQSIAPRTTRGPCESLQKSFPDSPLTLMALFLTLPNRENERELFFDQLRNAFEAVL